MPTINIKPGDTGTVPVSFSGGNLQEFVTPRNDGTFTMTPTNCQLYIYDAATNPPTELQKVLRDRSTAIPVTGGHPYMVLVVGTTDAQPTGSIAWRFD